MWPQYNHKTFLSCTLHYIFSYYMLVISSTIKKVCIVCVLPCEYMGLPYSGYFRSQLHPPDYRITRKIQKKKKRGGFYMLLRNPKTWCWIMCREGAKDRTALPPFLYVRSSSSRL